MGAVSPASGEMCPTRVLTEPLREAELFPMMRMCIIGCGSDHPARPQAVEVGRGEVQELAQNLVSAGPEGLGWRGCGRERGEPDGERRPEVAAGPLGRGRM